MSIPYEEVNCPFGKGLVATDDFNVGSMLFGLDGSMVDIPTMHTLQVDEGKHLVSDAPWRYMNHSCDPNGYIQVNENELVWYVTIKPIKKGDQFTFNYLATEWDMVSPFGCKCGATNCYKEIKGFKYLNEKQREPLLSYLSPYMTKMYRKNLDSRSKDEKTEETKQ